MEISITKDELYSMIKNAVRDVIHEEKADMVLKNLQTVGKEEMNDIENTYGSPNNNIEIANSEKIDI